MKKGDRTAPKEHPPAGGATTGERVRIATKPSDKDTIPDPRPIAVADAGPSRLERYREQNVSFVGEEPIIVDTRTLFNDLSRSVDPRPMAPRVRKNGRGQSETKDRDIDELLEELPPEVEPRKTVRRRRPNKTLTPVPRAPHWAPRTYGPVVGRRGLSRFLPTWFVRGNWIVRGAAAAALVSVFVSAIYLGRTGGHDDGKKPIPPPAPSAATTGPIKELPAIPSAPSALAPSPPQAPPPARAPAPHAPPTVMPAGNVIATGPKVVPRTASTSARPQKQKGLELDTEPLTSPPGTSSSESSPTPSGPTTADDRLLTGH